MRFRSKFEKSVFDAASKAKKHLSFEPHYVPYTINGNYLVDFVLPNGIHIECKGVLDAASAKKMRAVKTCHPELDIRFVFMDEKKKVPYLKMTHADWALKYGFKWANKFIPLEWWDE